LLYSPALIEWAYFEIFACSPGFGEFSDLGRQRNILHLTAEILLDYFKMKQSTKIKQKKTKKAGFMCKVFCVVTGYYGGVTSFIQLILHI